MKTQDCRTGGRAQIKDMGVHWCYVLRVIWGSVTLVGHVLAVTSDVGVDGFIKGLSYGDGSQVVVKGLYGYSWFIPFTCHSMHAFRSF